MLYMLFIKFKINNPSKFAEFKLLFEHMIKVRKIGFKFEEEEEQVLDWENMTDEEAVEVAGSLLDEPNYEEIRYKKLIPDYAQQFLRAYVSFDKKKTGDLSFSTLCIFSYLEFSFEVNMDELQELDTKQGVIRFSTLNFPYGGSERFLIVLRAYELIPFECYDGFTVYNINWQSHFVHEAIEQPEKTRRYLASFRNQTP
jgi:hypothetical protein